MMHGHMNINVRKEIQKNFCSEHLKRLLRNEETCLPDTTCLHLRLRKSSRISHRKIKMLQIKSRHNHVAVSCVAIQGLLHISTSPALIDGNVGKADWISAHTKVLVVETGSSSEKSRI